MGGGLLSFYGSPPCGTYSVSFWRFQGTHLLCFLFSLFLLKNIFLGATGEKREINEQHYSLKKTRLWKSQDG